MREFNGRSYLLEKALVADYALIKAWRGDRLGNLVYRKTARNFNPMMATAAKITIAEVEELVEPGEPGEPAVAVELVARAAAELAERGEATTTILTRTR